MPLPTSNVAWPPPAVAENLRDLSAWSAWYSGDPDMLHRAYALDRSHTPRVERASQYAGGIQGAVARWWWGKPTPAGEARTKLHVPLAADLAGTSADLLFAEPPTFTADNDGLQEALDVFVDDGVHAQLHEAAEVDAALGGVYLRIVWDSDMADRPWFDAVHADAAAPEFQWGRMRAVTFWHVLPDNGTGAVWRSLERHEPGRIEYGLYSGTASHLGRRMALADHPDTAGLADMVDAESGVATGTNRLTAEYIPNMLPNRLHRGSPFGRSDYQSIEPLFDALDEAYSSWHRDIRLGKARIHVPESMLDTDGPGTPAEFDVDRELYVPLRTLDKGEGMTIAAQQFAIRYAEHAQTCRDWANKAIQSAGYSTQTFGETGDGAVTATEVKARERRSYLTRGKKVRYWKPALVSILHTWVEVANVHFGAGIPQDDIDVTFGDAVADDPGSMARTAQTLRSAEAASTDTIVRMLHPDWDDEKVVKEVAAIDSSAILDDPHDAGF